MSLEHKKKIKLLAFGEVLWDVYGKEKYIGGAPFNFAAHFSKCGGMSYLISSVGNDDLGRETVKYFERYGIDTEYLTVLDNKITGRCDVSVNEKSIPCYNLLNDVAYDYIKPQSLNEKFDIFYFGTLSLRNEYNRNSLEHFLNNNSFSEIFVDINIRPPYYSDETVKTGLKNATILKISEEELNYVTKSLGIKEKSLEEICKAISRDYKNIKIIIITKGENGSVCFEKSGAKFHYAKANPVKAVSTVGAGDSFSAAFSAKYLLGEDIDTCLQYASRLSAYVVSKKDAVPD